MSLELTPLYETPVTYEDALLFCFFCNHDGYKDWRIPTYEEWDLWLNISLEPDWYGVWDSSGSTILNLTKQKRPIILVRDADG